MKKTTLFLLVVITFTTNKFELLSNDNRDSNDIFYRTIQIDYTNDIIQHEQAFSIGITRTQFLDNSLLRPLSAFVTVNFNFFQQFSINKTLADLFIGFRMDDRDKKGIWTVVDIGSGISFFNHKTFVAGIFRYSLGYSNFSLIISTRVYSSKEMDIDIWSLGLGYNF